MVSSTIPTSLNQNTTSNNNNNNNSNSNNHTSNNSNTNNNNSMKQKLPPGNHNNSSRNDIADNSEYDQNQNTLTVDPVKIKTEPSTTAHCIKTEPDEKAPQEGERTESTAEESKSASIITSGGGGSAGAGAGVGGGGLALLSDIAGILLSKLEGSENTSASAPAPAVASPTPRPIATFRTSSFINQSTQQQQPAPQQQQISHPSQQAQHLTAIPSDLNGLPLDLHPHMLPQPRYDSYLDPTNDYSSTEKLQALVVQWERARKQHLAGNNSNISTGSNNDRSSGSAFNTSKLSQSSNQSHLQQQLRQQHHQQQQQQQQQQHQQQQHYQNMPPYHHHPMQHQHQRPSGIPQMMVPGDYRRDMRQHTSNMVPSGGPIRMFPVSNIPSNLSYPQRVMPHHPQQPSQQSSQLLQESLDPRAAYFHGGGNTSSARPFAGGFARMGPSWGGILRREHPDVKMGIPSSDMKDVKHKVKTSLISSGQVKDANSTLHRTASSENYPEVSTNALLSAESASVLSQQPLQHVGRKRSLDESDIQPM